MMISKKIKVYDKGLRSMARRKTPAMRIGYRAGDMWAPHLPAGAAN
jgi:hypothetical protein